MAAKMIAGVLALAVTMVLGQQQPNIVQLAEKTPELSLLVKAVVAGGLVDALSGPGPLTVFAPTNRAFEELPPGVLDHLLDPANKKELVDLLTYHVAAGRVMAGDLHDHEEIKTLEGKNVTAYVAHGEVYINYARVITPNANASNGVVHIIDRVLVPPRVQATAPTQNIVQLAQATPDLSTLVTAVVAGGLATTLSGPGPFTVFAPTNEAFAQLPKSVLDFLLKPENKKELVDILTYHVVAGAAVPSSALRNRESIRTVQGSNVTVYLTYGEVFIDYAQVTTANVEATNGIVHIINHVILPPKFALDSLRKLF